MGGVVGSIGHGRQLVSQLGSPPFRSAQRQLLLLTLVVFGASIHVVLAVAQR